MPKGPNHILFRNLQAKRNMTHKERKWNKPFLTERDHMFPVTKYKCNVVLYTAPEAIKRPTFQTALLTAMYPKTSNEASRYFYALSSTYKVAI